MNQNFFVIYAEIMIILGLLTLINFNKTPIKNNSYVWVAFMVVPVLYFYFIIFSHTDNIPFKDDYSLLESLYKMEVSTTFSEWSKAFLQQVNQHRFGFERTVIWLIYKTVGNEDLKAQIVIGNGFLLGIIYLLFKVFRTFNLSIAYFVPLPLLIFNLTYFENATWGIAAIQNTPIIFFALLTVHLLNKNTISSYYWAIAFSTVTLFTSGNGLALWLVGILILTLQKRWKNLGLWLVLMIGIFTFYFGYDYQFISSDRANLLAHPFLNIQFILAFWGSVFFQNVPHPNVGHRYLDILICILTGIFLATIIATLCWKIFKLKFQNMSFDTLTILGGMSFLACTGLMLVLSRPVEVKIIYGGEILSRRYMIFGAVFLSLGYLGYLNIMQKKRLFQQLGFVGFIIIGLFLNLNSYYSSLSDLYTQQQELKLDGYYWKNHQMLLSFGEKYGEKIGYNHPTYMINLIEKLDSSGIYRLSESESFPLALLIKNADKTKSKIFNGKIEMKMRIGSTIAREIKARILFEGVKNIKSQNIEYIALKSKKNVFIVPAVTKTNSLEDCILTQKLNASEFKYETWKAKFPPDIYEIWVIEAGNQKNYTPQYCQKIVQL